MAVIVFFSYLSLVSTIMFASNIKDSKGFKKGFKALLVIMMPSVCITLIAFVFYEAGQGNLPGVNSLDKGAFYKLKGQIQISQEEAVIALENGEGNIRYIKDYGLLPSDTCFVRVVKNQEGETVLESVTSSEPTPLVSSEPLPTAPQLQEKPKK